MSSVTRVLSLRARPAQPRRLGRMLLVLLGVAIALWVLGYAAVRLWRVRELNQVVQRGLALLERARTPQELESALLAWEKQSAEVLAERRDALTTALFEQHSLTDRNIRLLLAHLTGADFGARPAHWQRWFEQRHRPVLRAGPRSGVTLRAAWQTSVGLTAGFSTILPVDGVIYVGSLGKAFDDESDAADALLRIDGRTGATRVLLTPRERPPNDVLGLAMADGRLYAAVRGGLVYCLSVDGDVHWKASVGSRVASTPLVADLNSSGPADVAVVTETGKLVALNGADGRALWVAAADAASLAALEPAQRRFAPRPALPYTLSLGTLGTDERETLVILTSITGAVRGIRRHDGHTLWRRDAGRGVAGGMVTVEPAEAGYPSGYVADLRGTVWGATRGQRGVNWYPLAEFSPRGEHGCGAAPRLIARPSGTPAVVACTTGEYGADGGSVALLGPWGVEWRYPVRGVIWSSPALGDVNGDRASEIIATSAVLDEQGRESGLLHIFDETGTCLVREWLDAAADASPVLADVDGDAALELLIADRAGRLTCIQTTRSGPIEWGVVGGDPRNTRQAASAYSFSQTPYGMQQGWSP